MMDWKAFTDIAALALAAFLASGFAALGVATACRLLKWAPINITINVHRNETGDDPTP